jgi:hypothetical protein
MIWSIQKTEQIQAVGEIEHSNSDRVVAIVCGEMVEQRLEISLTYRLRPHEHAQKQLLKPTGPLGPFKNKIDLGFLLYMYDKPMWLALSSIAAIRNKFAHRLDQSFFHGDEEFNNAMKHLVLHQGVKFFPNPFIWSDTEERLRKPTTNKQIFLANTKLAFVVLMRDMLVHVPQSNEALVQMPRDPPIVPPSIPGGASYMVQRRPRRRGAKHRQKDAPSP